MMIINLVKHLKDNLGFEFYPQIAPKSAKSPCGVYNIISEKERIGVNLGSFQTDFFIQIDIYTKTYKEANLIKEKLKDVLFSFERPIISLSFNIDFEDGEYRLMCEFESFE